MAAAANNSTLHLASIAVTLQTLTVRCVTLTLSPRYRLRPEP